MKFEQQSFSLVFRDNRLKESIMTNRTINHLDSDIYARLAAINLSSGERASAIEAARDGEKIADAILRVAHVLRLLVAVPALKPNFKPLQHSFKH